MALVQSLCAVN